MAKTMPRTPVISTEAKRSGEISRRNVASPMVAGDLSALRFIRALSPCHPYRRVSPSRGRKVQQHHLLFPLEGKCRAAAKGCTRLRVEMKRKGCPDRQTAACRDGVSFAVLAIEHPRATLWPSPPRWEACHLILSRFRLPANQVPLPPQGAQGEAAQSLVSP